MTAPNPSAWGLMPTHIGTDGRQRTASTETVDHLLAAVGADRRRPEPGGAWPLVTVQGEGPRIGAGAGTTAEHWEVELEDGSARACGDRLPADLPLGYHRLHRGGRSRPLVVTPPRCHLPDARGFGFAVQLYATRSAASWGIGDLADLAGLGAWARELGASMLLVNPLHAGLPLAPIEPSPYFPTSRLFVDPLLLRPDRVAGGTDGRAAGHTDVADLAVAARLLNRERRIDRDRVASLKMAALERTFRDLATEGELDAALAARPRLRDFAIFCALAERHGKDWRDWPRPLARRDHAAVGTAAAELAGRVRFHAWVQLQLDHQMEEAGAALPLIRDLAVGFHPGGADAWLWQEMIVPGVTVGAPPDGFNSLGQDWGIPAFDPWKLRACGYAPFIETLRANLREGAGLRIDHVMGLQRLWCIPAGGGPAEGCYLGYPARELLGIVALESVRHRATVIGEDLGTVPAGFRARLRRRGLLSYVVLLFEDRPPARWPRQALAAVTTHDLPTVSGLWDGTDLEARRRIGLPTDAAATEELVERIRRGGGPTPGAENAAAVVHAHRRLAASRCTLLASTLEDVAGVGERPNQPGSGAESPNWSLALPLPRERLQELPMAGELARLLSRGASTLNRPGRRDIVASATGPRMPERRVPR